MHRMGIGRGAALVLDCLEVAYFSTTYVGPRRAGASRLAHGAPVKAGLRARPRYPAKGEAP